MYTFIAHNPHSNSLAGWSGRQLDFPHLKSTGAQVTWARQSTIFYTFFVETSGCDNAVYHRRALRYLLRGNCVYRLKAGFFDSITTVSSARKNFVANRCTKYSTTVPPCGVSR